MAVRTSVLQNDFLAQLQKADNFGFHASPSSTRHSIGQYARSSKSLRFWSTAQIYPNVVDESDVWNEPERKKQRISDFMKKLIPTRLKACIAGFLLATVLAGATIGVLLGVYLNRGSTSNLASVTCTSMETGTTVAGLNGSGSNLNQLNFPNGIYVDVNYNVFVTDFYNNRVMKWVAGATEGVVVAGGGMV
ncbi:unnamed protein product [Didymodactylos carnosus]|uniref:Uncharacterized protein n=1 Tax=Didymodactylos carnosus TaxID=1234261 RepID=A0A816BQM2_9BILA|nr:unnamed protein product [Didymodactylos carnosus]CAF4495880.1 unnamed protein product [Didymodactylos carnosus]